MSVIYKYELEPKQVQDLMMPVGAKILHVANQFEKICLWALVDRLAEHKPRRFVIFLTGEQDFEAEKSNYLGTVLMQNGVLVLHVFEPLPPQVN